MSDTQIANVENAPLSGRKDRLKWKWLALAVMCGVAFVGTSDHLGFNSALRDLAAPKESGGLNANASQLTWFISAFTLALSGWLIAGGQFGDRFGRKKVWALGLIIFGGASVCAAEAGTPLWLIEGRYAMGVGGALALATSLATIRNMFSGKQRTIALGMWTTAGGAGLVAGSLVSGTLYDVLDFYWGSFFWLNVPVVIVALMCLPLFPETRDPNPRKLDPVGLLVALAALTLLTWALIEAPTRGWDNPAIVIDLGAFPVLVGGWILWEKRSPHPLIDLSLFAQPRYTAAVVSQAATYFTVVGGVFLMTLWLLFVKDNTPLGFGLRLLPVGLAIIVAAQVAVALVERKRTKLAISAGLLMVASAWGCSRVSSWRPATRWRSSRSWPPAWAWALQPPRRKRR